MIMKYFHIYIEVHDSFVYTIRAAATNRMTEMKYTGACCRDMPPQANLLLQRMRADPRVNMVEDWKMVTLFVGGNDLCGVCKNVCQRIDYVFRFIIIIIKR